MIDLTSLVYPLARALPMMVTAGAAAMASASPPSFPVLPKPEQGAYTVSSEQRFAGADWQVIAKAIAERVHVTEGSFAGVPVGGEGGTAV